MPDSYYTKTTGMPPLTRDVNGNVQLYRTMNEAEYNQLINTRTFMGAPGTMENKWFSTTINDAHTWGQNMDFGENYKIIGISVPEDSLKNFYYAGEKLDGIGPAFNAECDFLNTNNFGNSITTIK